jgi:hypothetical protein
VFVELIEVLYMCLPQFLPCSGVSLVGFPLRALLLNHAPLAKN